MRRACATVECVFHDDSLRGGIFAEAPIGSSSSSNRPPSAFGPGVSPLGGDHRVVCSWRWRGFGQIGTELADCGPFTRRTLWRFGGYPPGTLWRISAKSQDAAKRADCPGDTPHLQSQPSQQGWPAYPPVESVSGVVSVWAGFRTVRDALGEDRLRCGAVVIVGEVCQCQSHSTNSGAAVAKTVAVC
jgi:hypothetical protein